MLQTPHKEATRLVQYLRNEKTDMDTENTNIKMVLYEYRTVTKAETRLICRFLAIRL